MSSFTRSQLLNNILNDSRWRTPAKALATALRLTSSSVSHFSANSSRTSSILLISVPEVRIRIPNLLNTFSISFIFPEVSSASSPILVNTPALTLEYLEIRVLSASPAVLASRCVTSVIVVTIAAVSSSESPACWAVVETRARPSAKFPAEIAATWSIFVNLSTTDMASSVESLKPFIALVKSFVASVVEIIPSLASFEEAIISLLASSPA